MIPARGAAFGDLFNDGKIDVVMNNLDAPPTLLRNVNRRPPSLDRVAAAGWAEEPARCRRRRGYLTRSNQTQRADVLSGGSFASSNDPRVHFGLGDATSIGSVDVRWPGGGPVEKITVPGVDRILTIEQGRGVTHEYCPKCSAGKHK